MRKDANPELIRQMTGKMRNLLRAPLGGQKNPNPYEKHRADRGDERCPRPDIRTLGGTARGNCDCASGLCVRCHRPPSVSHVGRRSSYAF